MTLFRMEQNDPHEMERNKQLTDGANKGAKWLTR